MTLSDIFNNINWLAVLLAAVASFALGGLWYSPVLFAKIWMRETGMTPENAKGANIPLVFGTTFVLQFGTATFLAIITRGDDSLHGALKGLLIGGAFVATAIGTNYLYERKSLTLYLINTGYSVLLLGIMGAVLGAMK